MKLYEIDEALQACFDEETGELLNPEGFEELVKTRKDKIESLYTLVNELRNAEAAPLKAEKQALEARLRDTKQRIEELRKLLNDFGAVYYNIKEIEAQCDKCLAEALLCLYKINAEENPFINGKNIGLAINKIETVFMLQGKEKIYV